MRLLPGGGEVFIEEDLRPGNLLRTVAGEEGG